MKTHPHLLVRDVLAALFVSAAAGEPEARAQVTALGDWCEGRGAPPPLRVEDGRALFDDAGELAAPFAGADAYLRDRAARFAAACAWIERDQSARDPVERARAAWDAGLFFEVHELLEPVWLNQPEGPRRELLQGLIMAGAALHHLTLGNTAGARGLLGDAARRLAGAADARLDLAAFASGLTALREAVVRGDVRVISDVDEPPRLERL